MTSSQVSRLISPMVAIGSHELVGVNELYLVTDRLTQAGVRVHLFGTTNYDFIRKLPVFSCDATTWQRAGGFGHILYWNPEKPGLDKTDKIFLEDRLRNDGKQRTYFMTYPYRRELEAYLDRDLGLTYEDVLVNDRGRPRQLANLHYYYNLEQTINPLRGESAD